MDCKICPFLHLLLLLVSQVYSLNRMKAIPKTIKQYLKYVIVEQKPNMFTYKLKFTLLPQLIATLNNDAYSLPPLANIDLVCFSKVLFVDHVNPQLVK